MEFRLYPNPTNNVCTPFVYVKEYNAYLRFFNDGSSENLISIINNTNPLCMKVNGYDEKVILGEKIPNREMILEYLQHYDNINNNFLFFVKNTYVVPTFTLSKEEAFIKTVIRQIINAKYAKIIFSNFVKKFGYKKHGIYGFPTFEQLRRISINNLKKFGLGFKADRIWEGIRLIRKLKNNEFIKISGIGLWSKEILDVEIHKNYSFYPFWDKSGEKIKKVCGINLIEIAKKRKSFSGDIFLYAASYLESLK